MADQVASGLVDALVDFAGIVGRGPRTEELLQALGDYCTELLGVDGAGILFLEDGGSLTVGTANSELGRLVEEAEAELGEGPCTDSAGSGEQVVVPDLSQELDRYPTFGERCLPLGVRAIHALPMYHRSHWVGALDIISTEPGELDPMQLNTAQLLVEVAVSYLANSRAFAEQTRTAQQLQHALDSRVVIEQAKGKLAERHGIRLDEAFERMRSRSRSTRTKLREVAAAIVADELDL